MKGFNLKLTTAIVASLFASPLYAQDNKDVAQLETVEAVNERIYDAIATEKTRDYSSFASTVGTKRPAALREIPQSISVITSQQIKDREVNTLDQLAAQIPGLRIATNDPGRSSVYARGYEYSEYNIDGLPAPMASIMGTLPNLIVFDRVEIMRGPSGLFDSSGELGGIINFVRKRPTKDFQASIGAGYGTSKRYNIDGDVSGSLNASGTLRGRLIAQTNGVSYKPAEKNNRNETLYAALDVDLTPSTTLGIGYLFQKRHLAPDNGYPTYNSTTSLLPLPQRDFNGADWNRFDSQSQDFFADLKHYFDNGGHAKVSMRYSNRKTDFNYAFGTAVNALNQITAVSNTGRYMTQKSFALDASYSQPFMIGKTRNDFVVGADYNSTRQEDTQYRSSLRTKITLDDFASSYPYQNPPLISITKPEQTEYGLYGKLVLRPVSSLSVIMGGRIGHYSTDYNFRTFNPNGTLNAAKSKNGSRSDTSFTGYAGLVFDFLPNQSLYASYSSLYIPQDNQIDLNGDVLKPRQGTQFEFGYKGSFNNDALNVRLSAFRLQDKNAATPIPGTSDIASLGKRTIRGFEAEVSGEITDKWRVHAGYTYLDTKVDAGDDVGAFGLMPRHSGNIWTTYDITDKFTVGVGVNAVSKFSYTTQGATIEAPGYATYDLMATYRFTDKFNVQVNVNNLFNRHYYERVGSKVTFNIPGKERNIFVSARYSF